MVVYCKSTYTEWDTEQFLKMYLLLKRLLEQSRMNVLQFCPLCDFYVVNVIQPLCTLTGQKYLPTKIFPYIFHIKPLIFITFSWSHSLADFHEIFTFNSRIIIFSEKHYFIENANLNREINKTTHQKRKETTKKLNTQIP
jgi:hypothetical protein